MSQKVDQAQPVDPDILALEQFLLDNPELDEIETELSVFNPFETLSLTHVEIRHSNVLAWLLDPRENHGLGSFFLKRFIQQAVSNNRELLGPVISVIELDLLDFGDVEVRREWNRIDLTIICRDERMSFVVAIENKIHSDEHSNQLARYSEILDRSFPDFPHVRLFLTPDGRPPKDDDNWAVVDYGTVDECIDLALKRSRGTIGEDTRRFIQQYQSILRRYIVGGDRIEELCRRIYAQHPRALDLIFEYKPDLMSEVRDMLVGWVGSHKADGLVLDSDSKSYIRFTLGDLDSLPRSAEGWTKSKRVLLFEFENYNKLVLRLIIGPGETPHRKALHDLFMMDKGFFGHADRTVGKKWHTVWQKNILTKKDMDAATFDDISGKIESRLDEILSKDLPRITTHFQEHWTDLEGNGAS